MLELMTLLFVITVIILSSITLTTQTIEGTYGGKRIIVGGPSNYKDFCVEREIQTGVTIYPGRFASGAGQTTGEVKLAASGDGDAGGILQCIERVGAKSQNIDTGITAGQTARFLRQTGLFKTLCWIADAAAGVEEDMALTLEADGMLTVYAESSTNVLTADQCARSAKTVADIATTDLIGEVYF